MDDPVDRFSSFRRGWLDAVSGLDQDSDRLDDMDYKFGWTEGTHARNEALKVAMRRYNVTSTQLKSR